MKKALILQGWLQKIDSNFYPWLKSELEKRGYSVVFPDLPTMQSEAPQMKPQLEVIEKAIDVDEETIVLGHSLGSVLAMRLAEKHKFKKLFLIAGWDFNDLVEELLNYWPTPIDHQKIKENVQEIYTVTSDNDPYETVYTVENMSRRLGAKMILIKGKGHFTTEDGVDSIPELLEFI